jgi:hypothetical protein
MTTVVDEYDEFKKYTIKSAKTLHLENSWDSIADKMIKRFEFIENIL